MSQNSRAYDMFCHSLDVLRHTTRRQKVIYTAVIAVTSVAVPRLVSDYREFISLGPGGVPYNIFGWMIITCLFRPLAMRKSQAISLSDYPSTGAHDEMQKIPVRSGERAVAKGIIPHRQMSQNAPESMRNAVLSLFTEAQKQNPTILEWRRSFYEKHNNALFAKLDVSPDRVADTARISKGEIGHPHHDLSVHLYLSPADAKIAVERKWAERHRLSVSYMKWFGLDTTFLLFYGPRDEAELEVLRIFLRNSIRFMTGVESPSV